MRGVIRLGPNPKMTGVIREGGLGADVVGRPGRTDTGARRECGKDLPPEPSEAPASSSAARPCLPAHPPWGLLRSSNGAGHQPGTRVRAQPGDSPERSTAGQKVSKAPQPAFPWIDPFLLDSVSRTALRVVLLSPLTAALGLVWGACVQFEPSSGTFMCAANASMLYFSQMCPQICSYVIDYRGLSS